MFKKKFPFYKQQNIMECGPICLKMIASYYGSDFSSHYLGVLSKITKRGVSLLGINEAAEKIGFQTMALELTIDEIRQVETPCILYWQNCHFVVLYKISKNKFSIADPKFGKINLSEKEFIDKWLAGSNIKIGISLLLNPTPDFCKKSKINSQKLGWYAVLKYFYPYKGLLLQLVIGLCVGTVISLITPFLTQAIVDIGISTQNINFVLLILIAQLMLTFGSITVDFIRSWILLHVSSRINISILTDFLIKIMKLPISFFQTRSTGDIMLRMSDQEKIESFLTGTSLNVVFSIVNLFTFGAILFYYNHLIFWISILSAGIYLGWISYFLKYRRELNYKQFEYSSSHQNNMVEIIEGMTEIKLNNSEKQKRWLWEDTQANLFNAKVSELRLTQFQQAGTVFINQARNILITFVSVNAVITNQMSLGGMMAIQFMVGQFSNPVEQIRGFIKGYQDAKISLERLNEIHGLDDEGATAFIKDIPVNSNIIFKNLSFTYPGAGNKKTLKNIALEIPDGKITAIVGISGSGKTTLLKMLLRFFLPETGEIKIGEIGLDQIDYAFWREQCGTVMQDGYIFNDTIEGNITMGDEAPDLKKINKAIEIANIRDFIDGLPLGLSTRIGSLGNGISQGQRQRLLIARAVYKNPKYLFFDEATNALDSNNERQIMDNLNVFFSGKTVIIVAHRLSTVVNADKIVVIKDGSIIEEGTHSELIGLQKAYYELVKNQLKIEV